MFIWYTFVQYNYQVQLFKPASMASAGLGSLLFKRLLLHICQLWSTRWRVCMVTSTYHKGESGLKALTPRFETLRFTDWANRAVLYSNAKQTRVKPINIWIKKESIQRQVNSTQRKCRRTIYLIASKFKVFKHIAVSFTILYVGQRPYHCSGHERENIAWFERFVIQINVYNCLWLPKHQRNLVLRAIFSLSNLLGQTMFIWWHILSRDCPTYKCHERCSENLWSLRIYTPIRIIFIC